MMDWKEYEWKQSCFFENITLNFPGDTWKNHEKPQSSQPVS
jgi:hypothetical protein